MKKLVELNKSNAPKKFACVVDDSKSLSEQVQKYLFEHLGARWAGGPGQEVRFTEQQVLFVAYSNYRDAYEISYGTREYLEKVKDQYQPLIMNATIAVTLNSIKVEAETVKINGKEYLAADVEAALKQLQTV